MLFRNFLFGGGDPDNELLDRPISNFDVIGIPTGKWSSNLFGCFSNCVPSCVLSFFCPCMMWSQIVVRAQIPMLISIKNSVIRCGTRKSGYGAFIDYFMWSFIIAAGFIVLLATVPSIPYTARVLIIIVIVLILGPLIYFLSHTRTAFREKYMIEDCPPGCHFWEMLMDCGVTMVCLPCSLAQMARHVFQYDRMDTKLGLFLADPSTLPPLRHTDLETGGIPTVFERPERADRAGLTWEHAGHHPDAVIHTGAADRQREIQARQQEQMRQENQGYNPNAMYNGSAPVQASAVVIQQPAQTGGGVYNKDGSRLQ